MASDALGAAFLAVSLVLAPAVAGNLAEKSRMAVDHGRGPAGAAVAAPVGGSGSPDAAGGAGDSGDGRSDEWTALQVQAQLADEPTLESAAEIEVLSTNGVVTLRGAVPSEAARERALQLARAAPGVVTVTDELNVREH